MHSLLSATVKEFRKLINICCSYVNEYSVVFFGSRCSVDGTGGAGSSSNVAAAAVYKLFSQCTDGRRVLITSAGFARGLGGSTPRTEVCPHQQKLDKCTGGL